MSRRCAVLNCPYVGNKIRDKKTLFGFPQIASVIEKWIAATGRTNWIPSEYSVICEMHFTSEDFSNTKIRKRLKPDAIPTKHLCEIANSTDMYGNNMHLATTVESDKYRDVLQYTIEASEIKIENDSIYNLSSLTNTDTIETSEIKIENDGMYNLSLLTNADTIGTSQSVIEKENDSMHNLSSLINTGPDKINNGQLRKRKNPDTLEKLEKKIQKLEEENKNLKHQLKCSQNSCEKKLQLQAETFKILQEEQKTKYTAKITKKNKQLKASRISVNRKKSKIKDLIAIIKNTNVLSHASYQILNNEFGEMSSTLSKNECKNQGKPAHGR